MRRFVILLRWTTLILAGLLLLTVGVSSLIAPQEPTSIPERIVHLFATDRVVQRTAIFSALGLLATAVIFFRVRPSNEADPTPPAPEA